MNNSGKPVNIYLKTFIRDGEENEETELSTTGQYFQKSRLGVLQFKEKVEDAIITTMITIQQDKVSIKRSGLVSMHQQFRLGQLTENVYKHPHGNLHMETFTNRLDYSRPGKQIAGKLELDYTVKLNGQQERNHRLELLITEGDQE